MVNVVLPPVKIFVNGNQRLLEDGRPYKPEFQYYFNTKIEKLVFAIRLIEYYIGRRDWTRTNDPHHVKVVL